MAHLVKQKKTCHVGPDGKRCKKTAPGARKSAALRAFSMKSLAS